MEIVPSEKKSGGSLLSAMLPRPPRTDSKLPVTASVTKEQQVWQMGGQGLTPLTIVKGASDGFWTEIVSGPVDVGAALVTGIVATE